MFIIKKYLCQASKNAYFITYCYCTSIIGWNIFNKNKKNIKEIYLFIFGINKNIKNRDKTFESA